MEHLKNFSLQQIDNIDTLRLFLWSDEVPPPRFQIRSWMELSEEYYLSLGYVRGGAGWKTSIATLPAYNHCGTTACAVGHGPLAGIAPIKDESWAAYSVRCFGCGEDNGIPFELPVFMFMFGPSWEGKNNTAKGTSLRMKYFLEHGVPEGIIVPRSARDPGYITVNPSEGFWLEGLPADEPVS